MSVNLNNLNTFTNKLGYDSEILNWKLREGTKPTDKGLIKKQQVASAIIKDQGVAETITSLFNRHLDSNYAKVVKSRQSEGFRLVIDSVYSCDKAINTFLNIYHPVEKEPDYSACRMFLPLDYSEQPKSPKSEFDYSMFLPPESPEESVGPNPTEYRNDAELFMHMPVIERCPSPEPEVLVSSTFPPEEKKS